MSIVKGSVTFQRFAVDGEAPKKVTEELLQQFTDKLIQVNDFTVMEELNYGWCGIGHLRDREISFDKCVYNNCLVLNLRVDINKVPAAVVNSQKAMETEAAAKSNPNNVSGFISKAQKAQVKESVAKWKEGQQRTGKYVKSKLVEVVWDLDTGFLYTSASIKIVEMLHDLFNRTTGLGLTQMMPGTIAGRIADGNGDFMAYEGLKPTRFVESLTSTLDHPEYPWSLKTSSEKVWLGNEFVMWILWKLDTGSDTIPTLLPSGPFRNVALMVDRTLVMSCPYGQTGEEVMKGDGPERRPEAAAAIRSGKVPRQISLIAVVAASEYRFKLDAERMVFSSITLPKIEDAETVRALTEERIVLVRDLGTAMYELYRTFLKDRMDANEWESVSKDITEWATNKKG